jgi:predicted helicase
MSALTNLLASFRNAAVTEREKGTYFEELIIRYLRTEARYRDFYSDVWTYTEWATLQGLDKRDTGIDLVAKTHGTEEFHAIQCKFFADDYRVQKADIDSFFTASGKRPFTHRIIVTTSNNWSEHANDALQDQQPPATKIDLDALEQSQIDWSQYQPEQSPVLKPKKQLRPHQIRAVERVQVGLATAERGKLIMACGTGKTFTGLKIAETLAGRGKRVLFLVPSLSLLSQTLTEWTQESETPLHSFAVCSDSDVGKKRKANDDLVQTFAHELRFPATTNPERLAVEMGKRHDDTHMSVVFSTYHSIQVISDAQQNFGLGDFDLIICDEAHRTTGATFADDDESAFVRVHSQEFLFAHKRLYMTATPRIFGDGAKATAELESIALCSMDDEALYGKELFVITFSEAVKAGLLVDYKVLVLAMDEKHVSRSLEKLLRDDDSQIKVEDAAKIIGCWKALSKQNTRDDLTDDDAPMRRAVAFCQVIEMQSGGRTHKISSKRIKSMFARVVEEYKKNNADLDERAVKLQCEAEHIDGGMTASEKDGKLDWLKAEIPENTCRILSNVRCLSEGVDVPALDAVLFLTPRNSQVDVVQSVGRVMRKAEGKKRGYVVLPVVIPRDMEPHEALNDNKTYKVVWQVLQALRSHDDRFDAMINKLELVGADPARMEVIAVTDKIARKSRAESSGLGKRSNVLGSPLKKKASEPNDQMDLEFEIGEIERAIYAKIVKKCGNRSHWEEWATDIAKIAQTHITRIQTILENPENTRERDAFNAFAHELRDDLNDSITDAEVIEMLAQHLITKPVFEALFADFSFASQNPISKAMQGVLEVLQEHRLEREADTLTRFYDSVKMRAEGIDKAEGKQKIIVELYDKFFRNAFPRMTERLGIVYTPVEVVDFILHSVDHVLKTEFGQTLGSEGVHIIEPFVGTGTFITRLMQSGLITPEQLPHKYKHEIHANELVLLAYYIAAINIEAVYHAIIGGDYTPFEGICLTDTFQMYEKEDMIDALLVDNSTRRKRQKQLDIRVIFGNPPYSIGQGSQNDNNKNLSYPNLDKRITDTYVSRSKATLSRGLYDSYVRAIRWASDRIGTSGVIGFVSGSGFAEKPAMDGLRKCLVDEFSNVHILNLRGDIRKNMLTKGLAQEGQNIFGSASMTGIAVTIFVKNPDAQYHGQIYYHDIGNNLTTDQKLEKINIFTSIATITAADAWHSITPNGHGDWIKQRDDSFAEFVLLGDKRGHGVKLFENFSLGVVTNRDSWCYNASKKSVEKNMMRMIDFYNNEVARFSTIFASDDKKSRESKIDNFINTDLRKISWTRSLKLKLIKGQRFNYEADSLIPSLYRPFTNQWLYFNRHFNEMVLQMPRIFPNAAAINRVICVSGVGARSGFSALMADKLPCLDTIEKGQCFPLSLYDEPEENGEQSQLFATSRNAGRKRRDALTDAGLAHFQTAYPGEKITKEDVFYYVYGLLHSPDYRERFADNLSKELPRIPCVKTAADFWAFSKAGRALAEWHLNYETVPLYPGATIDTRGKTLTDANYRVEKMKYGGTGREKDRTSLIYNPHITVTGIPLEAYEYVVNGKPALDWVVERQCVKTDKDSGIVNDANDWAIETMQNPRYPLELFLRVITVSLETLKIVKALPPLDID